MLDSDLNNPKYADAQNPDRLIFVQFKEMPVLNGIETQKQGCPVYDTVLMCVMTPPGGLISVPEICTEAHKRRFPFHWQQYQNSKGVGVQIQGTPIDEWPALTVGQRESLKAAKFYTVQQIAGASDAQLQFIGMGGQTLREKAAAYLENAHGSAVAQQLAAKNAELEARLAALEGKPVAAAAPAVTVDLSELRAQYEAKTGKKPHHKLGEAKLREALAA